VTIAGVQPHPLLVCDALGLTPPGMPCPQHTKSISLVRVLEREAKRSMASWRCASVSAMTGVVLRSRVMLASLHGCAASTRRAGAITRVCAPGPLHPQKTFKSPKKELQNSGAEGMVQNQHLFGVFAP
jgi:hypothetical protein